MDFRNWLHATLEETDTGNRTKIAGPFSPIGPLMAKKRDDHINLLVDQSRLRLSYRDAFVLVRNSCLHPAERSSRRSSGVVPKSWLSSGTNHVVVDEMDLSDFADRRLRIDRRSITFTNTFAHERSFERSFVDGHETRRLDTEKRIHRPRAGRRRGRQHSATSGCDILTLAVRRRWHPAACVHVRLRLQMTDDRVPV